MSDHNIPHAYKVVRIYSDGRYKSATCCGRITMYGLNMHTVPLPGCGPLVLFAELEQARKFAREVTDTWRGPVLIFECEYGPSAERNVWPWGSDAWGPSRSSFMTPLSVLPEGTVLADWIQMTRMIEEFRPSGRPM